MDGLLEIVKYRRIAGGAPSPGIAWVVCDALRDYDRRRLTEKVKWVLGELEVFGFDRYSDIVPSMAYWPEDGDLPRTKTLRHQRVTPDLIERACVVYFVEAMGTHCCNRSVKTSPPSIHSNLR